MTSGELAPYMLAALIECADELSAMVEHHYAQTKDHPAMARRYERDMAPVVAARTAITRATSPMMAPRQRETQGSPETNLQSSEERE